MTPALASEASLISNGCRNNTANKLLLRETFSNLSFTDQHHWTALDNGFTIQVMLQLLFKPTAQKFCWTGFWPTIEFRAEVWNAEADQFKWNVRGRMNDGFKIYSSYGDEVIAQEKNERFCKWHLEFLCLKERTKENEVPIVTISRSGNYLWGHEKRPLDLFLEGKARVFESRRFKIIHRDCKNDLEISETAKVSDQLTAVWFCFWVWYRIWNDDS